MPFPFSNSAGARSAVNDFISDSRFALFDVAPIDSALALPIFIPLLTGFSAVTAPEMTIETMEIAEGNSTFHKQVLKGASVGAISISRGVRFYDSDFWRWAMSAAKGDTGSTVDPSTNNLTRAGEIGGVSYRRTMLLVHFFRTFGIGLGGNAGSGPNAAQNANVAAAIAGGVAISATTGALAGTAAGIAAGAQFAALDVWQGQFDDSTSVQVPARAFLLRGCIPTRYKTGSDFDANSGQISVQELEFAVESFEEISLFA
jgi:hypothetical protein